MHTTESYGEMMKNKLYTSCAFTGHRPAKFPWKYDETDSRCVALKAVLAEQIAALVNIGFTQFLSGMAEATDTWSALSVLDLREKNPAIKLHCILPCKEQADKWAASSRDLYHSVLDRAIPSSTSAGPTTRIVCWTATAFW